MNLGNWSSGTSYVIYTGSSTSVTSSPLTTSYPTLQRTELELLDERINGTCLVGRKALGLK